MTAHWPPVLLVGLPDWMAAQLVTVLQDRNTVVALRSTAPLPVNALRDPLTVALASIDATDTVPLGGSRARPERTILDLLTTFDAGAVAAIVHGEALAVPVMASMARAGLAEVFRVPLASLAVSTSGLAPIVAWVDAASARRRADALWAAVGRHVPAQQASLLRAALRLAHAPITVPDLATATGYSERHLRRVCQATGMPSPQWLIAMARLLAVGYLLEERGLPFADAAAMQGYASMEALHEKVRHWMQRSARSMLRDGWLTSVCTKMHAEAARTNPTIGP